MNNNGKSVAKALYDLQLSLDDVIVLHDDLDRRLGKLSWKCGGSAGGHNGVRSVIQCVGDDAFRRLRIGIGRPQHHDDTSVDVSDFVLSKFSSLQLDDVDEMVDRAVEMLIHQVVEPHAITEVSEGEGDEEV